MITEAHLQDYRSQGFCVLESELSRDELQVLENTCDALLAEDVDDGGGRVHDIGRGQDRRFLRLRHESYPELAGFVLGERIGALAKALLGAEPYLFVEQFVVKGPKTGANFAWHQDSGYVGFEHLPYLSLWISIDAATEANGCVPVLPRSLDGSARVVPHRFDPVNKERVGYDGDDPGIAVECPPGSIVAFSSLTMHRSGPNTTDRARRAYLCQYSVEPILDPDTSEPKHFAKRLA
ncbi:MAG: phytanoyl-CoA dioxygenase family protein [Acidimicrobiales bacterium]|nr:phytanoyl-CoA dioxygenase family protein [Acidimicrobiales bacterium]